VTQGIASSIKDRRAPAAGRVIEHLLVSGSVERVIEESPVHDVVPIVPELDEEDIALDRQVACELPAAADAVAEACLASGALDDVGSEPGRRCCR